MFIFSVFGMTMFKQVGIIPGFDDVHNFQTFVKTFVLLFQVNRGGYTRARITARRANAGRLIGQYLID